MDIIFNNLHEIFNYSSGFLIAWGIFASYTLMKMLLMAKKYRGSLRMLDVGFMVLIVGITITLGLLLLVFSNVASTYIIPLLIVMFWYMMFVVYFTFNYLEPCIYTYHKYNYRSFFIGKSRP
jgi:hypothetical protein